ncbi:diguanylate cyclase/phosphodiesterase 2 domain protein, partial [Vibrio parahaemolyticus EKP-028]
MQTRRELFFAPFQRLAVIAEQWRAGSKSYLTDLASIALLLLPLTLSNALAILLGHAFRVAGLGDVSLLLFHLSDILINLYPT